MSRHDQITTRLKQDLVQALDCRNVSDIKRCLEAYAENEQTVRLQVEARELLTRLLGGEVDDSILTAVRDIVVARLREGRSDCAADQSDDPGVSNRENDRAVSDANAGAQPIESAICRFWGIPEDSRIDADEIGAFLEASRVRDPSLGRFRT